MLDLKRCAEASIAEEFSEAQLGDVRRERRLVRIAEKVAQAPSVGFPRIVSDDSELEGVYRFFSNDKIAFEDVIKPHVDATWRRMRDAADPVLVVHDTTDLSFGGLSQREGLGHTHGNRQGFLLHVAFAVMPGEERLPLGTCALLRRIRTESKGSSRKKTREMWRDPDRESLRWGQLVEQVEALRDGVECIHLMDREGDSFDLFALLLRNNARFIVRGYHDRALTQGRLTQRLEALNPKVYREIEVSARPDDGRRRASQKTHPPRRGRLARVAIAATTVTVSRPRSSAHTPERELSLNVVRVWETSSPKGEPSVSWVLYTSEPIDTKEQLLSIVDHYRSRWIVEEFFKALKTGCSIEKRQLESYRGLSLVLAVFLPVAWRMLLARSLSRKIPNAPATSVATKVQLELLRHKLKLQHLPDTAEAATLAIAKLGGHLKRNGAPGWLTLGRGFESLLLMEAGWRAAMEASQRSDQS